MTDDRQRLLGQLAAPDVVIDGKLQGLVFLRWRVRQHLAANLLLQYAWVRCQVSVWRNWNPDEMEESVTKGPHSSSLEDDAISLVQVKAREK